MTPAIRAAAAGLLAGAALGRALAARADASLLVALAVGAAAAAACAVRTSGLRGPLGRAAATAALAAAACAAGALRAAAGGPAELALPAIDVAEADVVATTGAEPLEPPPPPPAARSWGFRVRAGDAEARVAIDVPDGRPPPEVLPGDRLRITGRVRPREPAGNPGAPRRTARTIEMDGASVERVEAGGAGLRRTAEALRAVLRRRLADACGGETPAFGLFVCLLTGDRSALPPEVARAFRDSGTAHLLAVSGLHLVLLVALFGAAGRRLAPAAVRARCGLAAQAALVVGYTAVCRFETPVARSAVFVLTAAVARSTARRPATLDHLALAAAIVVAWDPEQIADVGFQLSFAAVAGLSLLTTRFREAIFPRLRLLERFPEAMPRERLRRLRRLADGLATSCAAQSATAPVVASAFGTAQPLGPLVNLVAVPLFAAVLPVVLALAAAGGIAPAATRAIGEAVARIFVAVADAAASAPGGHVALGRPPPWVLAAGLALLAAGARMQTWRRRDLLIPAAAWAAVAIGPGVVAPAAAGPPGGARRVPEVVALDVGHGLCVLVRDADGTAVLYDAGGRAPRVGDRTIVPALRALGVRELAALCVSHEDADHCSGVADVVREIRVRRVVVAAGFGASPLAAAVLDACREAGVPVTPLLAGDVLDAGGLRAVVLHPAAAAPGGVENADSLVLHVAAAEGPALRVLLTGDVEGDVLEALAARDDLPAADVLVLPHHGRGEPAPQERLAAAVRAAVRIASAGDAATVGVRDAWTTGATGAVRVRAGSPPEAWPWD